MMCRCTSTTYPDSELGRTRRAVALSQSVSQVSRRCDCPAGRAFWLARSFSRAATLRVTSARVAALRLRRSGEPSGRIPIVTKPYQRPSLPWKIDERWLPARVPMGTSPDHDAVLAAAQLDELHEAVERNAPQLADVDGLERAGREELVDGRAADGQPLGGLREGEHDAGRCLDLGVLAHDLLLVLVVGFLGGVAAGHRLITGPSGACLAGGVQWLRLFGGRRVHPGRCGCRGGTGAGSPGWNSAHVSVADCSACDVARICSSTSRAATCGPRAGRHSSSCASTTTYVRLRCRPRLIATYRSSRPMPGAAIVWVSSALMPWVRAVVVA